MESERSAKDVWIIVQCGAVLLALLTLALPHDDAYRSSLDFRGWEVLPLLLLLSGVAGLASGVRRGDSGAATAVRVGAWISFALSVLLMVDLIVNPLVDPFWSYDGSVERVGSVVLAMLSVVVSIVLVVRANTRRASGGSSRGWWPDPSGRFELRFHDGAVWTDHVSTAGQWSRDAAPVSVPGGAAPSWYPDPFGRYRHRYWEGSRWTEHVSDGVVRSSDPLGATASLPAAPRPVAVPPPPPVPQHESRG